MAPSFPHERLKSLLTTLVEALATGLDLDFESAGSTTFKRQDISRGFESDACFYVQHVAAIHGNTTIDLATDPPPDLVLEIDITHPSLDKLPIYAAIGVSEVWRCDGQHVHMYRLLGHRYQTAETSVVLAGVTLTDITHFLELSLEITRAAWIRRVRQKAFIGRVGRPMNAFWRTSAIVMRPVSPMIWESWRLWRLPFRTNGSKAS